MAAINVTNIVVQKNPAKFTDPLSFEITFECLSVLSQDIEWKVVYMGSSEDEKQDQVLDSVLIGPLQFGTMRFVLATDGPDIMKVPEDEVLGITALLLTCSYREQEFFRIGYYVNNSYTDPELVENPPTEPLPSLIQRTILSDKPRITRHPINWNDPEAPN
jgi:histone chaperone ASF1